MARRIHSTAERERDRYGDRIKPGSDMHDQHLEFISWAESYDTASAPVRSLDLHETWMKQLNCPVLRLDSDRPIDSMVREVIAHVTA